MKTKFKLSSEWIIFFWCFLIATLFWFLRILNDNFSTQLNLPVKYVNLPENLTFISSPPDMLEVSIQGPGWDLLTMHFKLKKNELVLDMSQFNNQNFFIPNHHISKIAGQLPVDVKVINIYPDSILLNTDQIIHQKLPVIPNIIVTTDKQFGIASYITTTPDSIVVKGPEMFINMIDSITTDFYKFENLTHSVTQNLSLLKFENKFVEYEKSHITINIPVEKLTEKTISVPLIVKNPPQGYEVFLIPSSIELTFQTTLRNFDKINKNDFEVFVNAETIDTIHATLLEVKINQFTPFVYSTRTKPKYVNFLIQQQQ